MLRRRANHGRRDRATIDAIIDQALVCHVGFIDEGSPTVIPTSPWRVGDWLYLHGSANSRLLAQVAGGNPLCISLALVDGLVLARSALRHSLNYRSAAARRSRMRRKAIALMRLIDKLSPGRAARVRLPTRKELGVARRPPRGRLLSFTNVPDQRALELCRRLHRAVGHLLGGVRGNARDQRRKGAKTIS